MNKIVSILFLIVNSMVFSQKIHKNDIDKYIWKVKFIDGKPKNLILDQNILNPVLFYSTDIYSKTIHDKIVNDSRNNIITLGILPRHKTKAYLELPDNKTALIILYDLIGFESQRNLLTYWHILGDSLKYYRYDNCILYSSIGYVSLIECVSLPDKSIIFVVSSAGGDAGIYWGDYKFCLFDNIEDILIINSRDYQYNSHEDHNKISYYISYNSKKEPIVNYIENFYKPEFDKQETYYRENLVHSDTTHCNISELLSNLN